jgi:rod shape-determining protein MreC
VKPSLWYRLRDWIALAACLLLSVGVLFEENQPAVVGLRQTSLELTSAFEASFGWIGRYLTALDENERLREENIRMASELSRTRGSARDAERLRAQLAFVDTTEYDLLPVRVVSKSMSDQNYFTISAGTQDSVAVGMPVVDERGVLGRVVLTSGRYARVMPYLNTNFRASARVLPIDAEGVVTWDGNRPDRLTLNFISRTEPIDTGMVVVTSPSSGTFPPGFAFGKVSSVEASSGQINLEVGVEPSARLDQARYAYVVLYLPDPAQLAIDSADLE